MQYGMTAHTEKRGIPKCRQTPEWDEISHTRTQTIVDRSGVIPPMRQVFSSFHMICWMERHDMARRSEGSHFFYTYHSRFACPVMKV